jgi:Family of unknown function (DUF5335)
MTDSKIARMGCKEFFDTFSKALEGGLVELEIVGRDIGDQRYGQQLSLNGITYDIADDALYVSMLNGMRFHIEYVVQSPQEVHIEVNEAGLSGLMLVDPRGRQEFVWLREALFLPARTTNEHS